MRREPLELRGLDVASVRIATPTICCRTPVRDSILVEVNAARERQPTPRANLDSMVCKFLQNQQSDYNEARAYYMKRRKKIYFWQSTGKRNLCRLFVRGNCSRMR
ncbi:hypothetical protein Trydic_g22888 [Trypoxylus dichotomus]